MDVGYDVHVAQDGVIGLKQALSHAYDLIVLDLMLPGWKDWKYAETYALNPTTHPF
jgi:two-component system copper resistance phosphate regulon response regulator CusR